MANNKVQLADGTTLIDLTDTTAAASDVAAGKYFYTAAGVKTEGTASGGGGGMIPHTIHLEFTDSTDTDIDVDYDDSYISTMITAYVPDMYGAKKVALAQLDGVTWYEYTPETWDVLLNGTTTINATTPYNNLWLADLGNVYPTEGSVWRITIYGQEYRCKAVAKVNQWGSTEIYVGNPMYDGYPDDGSGIPFAFINHGYGAWNGSTELPASPSASIKVERLVTS